MRLGNQTIVVVSVTEDLNDRDRYGRPALVRTETEVRGCRFRPMTATEVTDDNGERVRDRWKLTAPPVAAITGLQPRDEVIHDGITFQIVGTVRTFTDLSGKSAKCTVLAERHLG